jgi:hypothetical protein
MKGFKVVVYISFPFPKLLGTIDATEERLSNGKLQSVDLTSASYVYRRQRNNAECFLACDAALKL